MVVNGKIEARPMMYLALSYDHRAVDGKEGVTFLIKVKECIEDPKNFPSIFRNMSASEARPAGEGFRRFARQMNIWKNLTLSSSAQGRAVM